ncbi:hypothetical protein SNEBB_002072 [Seison nebaliae]|nr:hypothetical protein SNEBB_002072 [Seison nebaliae]
MVRKLKYHEQKLLKKVDLFRQSDEAINEKECLSKFRIRKRQDLIAYRQLSRRIRELAHKIRDLDENDPFRTQCTKVLIQKLYDIGLISTKQSLELASKVNALSFCLRRLPTVMKKVNLVDSIQTADNFVRQSHVRVGVDVVTDPAFIVTRSQEDFITWATHSSVRKHIKDYQNERDDYELMN